jgi:hypothetical protein
MSFSGGRGGQSRLDVYRKYERNGKKAAGLLFSPEPREMPTVTSIGTLNSSKRDCRRARGRTDHDLCLRAPPERGMASILKLFVCTGSVEWRKWRNEFCDESVSSPGCEASHAERY